MKLSTLNQEDLKIIYNFTVNDFKHICPANYQVYAKFIVERFYLDEAFRNLFEYTEEEKEKVLISLTQPEVESAIIQLVYTTINGVEIETLPELMLRKGVDQKFINTYLLNIDELTPEEMLDLWYVDDRIDTHLEDYNPIEEDDSEENIFNGLQKDEFWKIVRTKLFERLSEVNQKYVEYSEFSDFGEQANKEMSVANIASYIIIEDIFGCVGDDLPLDFTEAPGVFINEMYDVDFVNEFIEDFIDEMGDRINNIKDEEVIVPTEFPGLTMSDINKIPASEIRNYGLIGALLNLGYDNYDRSDDRDTLEELLVKGLDTSKYSNLENIYGNGKDKTVPPALLKQFYNIAKFHNPNLEWVRKYEYVISQPKAAPKVKIKYVAVDKSTYETDKSGLEFTVEINGKKATGIWRSKSGGYNHDGMDIDELKTGEYSRIRIFNGGGSAKSYEISSVPVLSAKQPKNLRFTGRYYDTAPMGIDFVNKIREGLAGPTARTGATLTPEFLKYFNLNIEI